MNIYELKLSMGVPYDPIKTSLEQISETQQQKPKTIIKESDVFPNFEQAQALAAQALYNRSEDFTIEDKKVELSSNDFSSAEKRTQLKISEIEQKAEEIYKTTLSDSESKREKIESGFIEDENVFAFLDNKDRIGKIVHYTDDNTIKQITEILDGITKKDVEDKNIAYVNMYDFDNQGKLKGYIGGLATKKPYEPYWLSEAKIEESAFPIKQWYKKSGNNFEYYENYKNSGNCSKCYKKLDGKVVYREKLPNKRTNEYIKQQEPAVIEKIEENGRIIFRDVSS